MQHDKDYDKLLKRISQNIRTARESKGLTQEQMSELGFNYRHYQKLESGSYSPSLQTLYRVAKALKIELKQLIE